MIITNNDDFILSKVPGYRYFESEFRGLNRKNRKKHRKMYIDLVK